MLDAGGAFEQKRSNILQLERYDDNTYKTVSSFFYSIGRGGDDIFFTIKGMMIISI